MFLTILTVIVATLIIVLSIFVVLLFDDEYKLNQSKELEKIKKNQEHLQSNIGNVNIGIKDIKSKIRSIEGNITSINETLGTDYMTTNQLDKRYYTKSTLNDEFTDTKKYIENIKDSIKDIKLKKLPSIEGNITSINRTLGTDYMTTNQLDTRYYTKNYINRDFYKKKHINGVEDGIIKALENTIDYINEPYHLISEDDKDPMYKNIGMNENGYINASTIRDMWKL